MADIRSLRDAVEYLKTVPGEYAETDVAVKPHAEISGIYRYVGAGGTVKRPTKKGPAVMFNNVEGHEGARVLIGLLASRERVGMMLNEKPERLGFLLNEAVQNPVQPAVVASWRGCLPGGGSLCGVRRGFDIRKLLPAPTNTPEDAGPYITMGMCYASDPETGDSDITIHRLCLQTERCDFHVLSCRGRGIWAYSVKKRKEGGSRFRSPSALA